MTEHSKLETTIALSFFAFSVPLTLITVYLGDIWLGLYPHSAIPIVFIVVYAVLVTIVSVLLFVIIPEFQRGSE